MSTKAPTLASLKREGLLPKNATFHRSYAMSAWTGEAEGIQVIGRKRNRSDTLTAFVGALRAMREAKR